MTLALGAFLKRWSLPASAHALTAYEVGEDGLVAKLSDGICLGLCGHISHRSGCGFCQLAVHAFEHGADIEMLNYYDNWHEQEVWINNHVSSKQRLCSNSSRKDRRTRHPAWSQNPGQRKSNAREATRYVV